MIGTKTQWGTIQGILTIEGERYYFILRDEETVSLMPAILIDDELRK